MNDIYCPECGTRTLFWIEDCEPNMDGEYKEARCCETCGVLVYIVRLPNEENN